MPLALDHIAIHARDIAASVRFYGELLGLPEAVNPMGGTFRWFALTPGVNLHLAPGNAEPLPERPITTHIALRADDFDGMVKRLTQAGARFGELPNRSGRITTRPDGVRQCFVQDPDNYWIEINDAAAR
jgi:catechol 2,3-dioxygenase-like lactoylglutathione lyase family enzyme